ncbi:MAG: PIG-L deacetylase family protein, partial [Gemmataceae bacterium]
MPPLRILVLGAHPDDADIKAGGTAALWCRFGHEVKFISVTNGGAGHHQMRGEALVARRRAEAQAAGAIIGATYDVLDHPDGALLPT